MKSHQINKLENFIGGWYVNKKVCKNLIKHFEKANNKRQGEVGHADGIVNVDKSIKASTDVSVLANSQDKNILDYYKELTKVTNEYKKQYEYCDEAQAEWGLTSNWGIQKYKPKEGYFVRHYERSGGKYIKRHLVFMTYLNDVSDGGETEFYYQKLKVKPEIGLTLIFPADWTFTHNGITSPTQTKYISTGWYNYI